jgi:hypothetical protein
MTASSFICRALVRISISPALIFAPYVLDFVPGLSHLTQRRSFHFLRACLHGLDKGDIPAV